MIPTNQYYVSDITKDEVKKITEENHKPVKPHTTKVACFHTHWSYDMELTDYRYSLVTVTLCRSIKLCI